MSCGLRPVFSPSCTAAWVLPVLASVSAWMPVEELSRPSSSSSLSSSISCKQCTTRIAVIFNLLQTMYYKDCCHCQSPANKVQQGLLLLSISCKLYTTRIAVIINLLQTIYYKDCCHCQSPANNILQGLLSLSISWKQYTTRIAVIVNLLKTIYYKDCSRCQSPASGIVAYL